MNPTMPLFIHHLNPIALKLGFIQIHWYALMYLFGIAFAYGFGRFRLTRTPHLGFITKDEFDNTLSWVVFSFLIGGRLGYAIFYGLDYWQHDFFWVFRIWEGGMSFHGALFGATIATFLNAWYMKRNFLDLADFASPLAPIGIGLGRIGNFINGELWGKPTDLPWGIAFPNSGDFLSRHPSQLYEFFLEGVVMFCILYLVSKKKQPRGLVTMLLLALYAFFRILVEFVREPDRQLGFLAFHFLTMGQILSSLMLLMSFVLALLLFTGKLIKPDWEPRKEKVIKNPKAKK